MKPIRCALTAAAIASLSVPAAPSVLSEEVQAAQIVRAMAVAEIAVACGLRAPDWRKPMLSGWFAIARQTLKSSHPDASDGELSAEAMKILQAAKSQAAMTVQAAAPTNAQCDNLSNSRDLQELDATAMIGLNSGALGDR
jgi:hypothetical protein